jgi:copper chaperone CopZ
MRLAILLSALVLLLPACGEPAEPPAEPGPAKTAELAPLEDDEVVVLDVEGMSCNTYCTPKVKKLLLATEGVVDATVDLDSKSATVRVRKGTPAGRLCAAVASSDEYTAKLHVEAGEVPADEGGGS